MKRPRQGSLLLVLTPDELLARLATLVPPLRSHVLRYHGVFAPNAKDRARVVRGGVAGETPAAKAPQAAPPVEEARSTQPFRLVAPEAAAPLPPRDRLPWAELLRKVLEVDVLACPRCDGRLEVIAFISEEKVARRILEHLGMDAQARPLARAGSPGEGAPADEPGPDYGADPVYEE